MLRTRVKRHAAAASPYLAGTAMLVAVVLCVTFTGLNTPLVAGDTGRQTVLAAAFSVLACAAYVMFMVVSRVGGFVMSYIEHGHYDELEPPGRYEGEDESLLVVEGEGGLGARQLAAANRDAIVASMHLGGSGTFLALPALCMWDTAATACFVLSLACIGFVSEETKVAEFRPNVDTALAISRARQLRGALYGGLLLTLVGAVWLDVHYTRAGEGLQWPLMLLTAASPLLLRLGSMPAAAGARLLMTPTQCLEAGLPVCTLLATLLLCWYSPLDEVLVREELLTRLAIPMLVLCPACLSAIVGFVLRGFRQKHSGVTATILALACVVRQQAVERGFAARGDCAVFVFCLFTLAMLAASLWQRHAVEARPRPAPPAGTPAGTPMREEPAEEEEVGYPSGEEEESAAV